MENVEIIYTARITLRQPLQSIRKLYKEIVDIGEEVEPLSPHALKVYGENFWISISVDSTRYDEDIMAEIILTSNNIEKISEAVKRLLRHMQTIN